MSAADPRARSGAFFGRRKGHRLRPHQMALFETLLPRLALDIAASAPTGLTCLFPRHVEAVELEIGFGGGEHMVARAQVNPAVGFIGCEPFVNGMAKALALIEGSGVDNIRLYSGDATEILTWLPAGSLSRVDLIYPDPWPKKRHWKRRFVQDATVAAIARLLPPGGTFRFVTDWPDYAAWTLIRMLRSPAFQWTAECADDWRKPWAGFVVTRYQLKAQRDGRQPCYLIFRRTGP